MHIIVTTKRLLSQATIPGKFIIIYYFHTFNLIVNNYNLVQSPHLATDGTYKLIYHGHPILMFGITDLGRHYHPFG